MTVTSTLIAADNEFALWAIMLLLVALVFRLEKTTVGQKISGTIMVIILGALLANFQVIPSKNEVFKSINDIGVPVAIVLLLFNANLKKIFKESGWTLVAFTFGAIGTTLGTLLGVAFLPLGDNTPELAAVLSATYIGGSANFVTVAEAIEFTNADLMAASIAADNVVGVTFMALLIAIPSMKMMIKLFGYDPDGTEYHTDDEVVKEEEKPFSIERALISLGIAFLIVWVSDYIANEIIHYSTGRLLIITALTVAIATFLHEKVGQLSEAFPIGIAVMYLFLGMVGASVDIVTMIESGMVIALFCVIILGVHLITILTMCKLFKVGLPEALVGSNACVLGPPTAAAMAGAMGWKTLITPAILCGTFGYAMANFIGISLFEFFG